MHQPQQHRGEQQRDNTDGGGGSAEGVGPDQFGALRQQPDPRCRMEGAAGAAVGGRGADPHHHDEHSQRTEPEPSGKHAPQKGGGQHGGPALLSRQRRGALGHLGHIAMLPMARTFFV